MELFSAKCYPAVQTVLDDPQLLVLGSLPVPKYGRTVPQVMSPLQDRVHCTSQYCIGSHSSPLSDGCVCLMSAQRS